MAVRAALGASRTRLIVQQMTETLWLALAGGVLGVLISRWALALARASLPTDNLPPWLNYAVDWRVLAFTLGVSIVTLLSVGVAPALTATHVDLSSPLKVGAAGDTASGPELRASRAMVIFEVALAFAMVAGSAFILQSFRRLQRLDYGIPAERTLTATILLSESQYADIARRDTYFSDAIERVSRLSGVKNVAIRGSPVRLRRDSLADSTSPPDDKWKIYVRGREGQANGQSLGLAVRQYAVTDDYFRTVGTRILRGRGFTSQDRDDSAPVAVLSERLAHHLWPTGDPIGAQIRLGTASSWVTVIGVVTNVQVPVGRAGGVGGAFEPAIYLSSRQNVIWRPSLLVRSGADPLLLAGSVEAELRLVDPDQPVTRFLRLSDELGQSARSLRWLGLAFATIAAGALALAAIGIYGVISYAVQRRLREIGVRLALGAHPSSLKWEVTKHALRLVMVGIAIGVFGAWALRRLMGSFLYGVSSYDFGTCLLVSAIFVGLGAIASYAPARRATRVDPLSVMRAQ